MVLARSRFFHSEAGAGEVVLGNIARHVEESDRSLVVVGVWGVNRQDNPASDVQLRPLDCADNPGLYLEEGVGVESQQLEGCEAKDVHLSPCVCNRIGDDLGDSLSDRTASSVGCRFFKP